MATLAGHGETPAEASSVEETPAEPSSGEEAPAEGAEATLER